MEIRVSLRIINLFAENIKRLKAVDISPKGSTVIISGKNEQGKSSVLDSFWLALKWSVASKINPMPIRDGTDHAMIIVDMGDYRVTRQFRLNGEEEVTTRLTVERANGDTVKSPQALIDSFIGSLSFDPLEFMRKTPKEQREMLAEISKLNLVELDAKHQALYTERTDLHREAKALTANISNIAPPTDASLGEVDTAALLDELNNLKRDLAESDRKTIDRTDLSNRINTLKTELDRLQALYDTTSPVDSSPLRSRIAEIEDKIRRAGEINARVREIKTYNDITTKINTIQNRVSEIESGLNAIQMERQTAIEKSELPIDGLRIGDEGVTFKDQPLSQLSTSQQIKISMVLAMAANPELRVIRIKDGSLLDKENLVLIDEIAKDGDFQVWIECVDDSGKMGFYIEDGTVAAVNECII